VVLDQFEELLIIREAASVAAMNALVGPLAAAPPANLIFLAVVRTDYLGKLRELDKWPPPRLGDNWVEIMPFTAAASRDFLSRTGLSAGDTLMKDLLEQAALFEETRGLIRPITLNMIGTILTRTALPGTALRAPPGDVSRWPIGYIRECVDNPTSGPTPETSCGPWSPTWRQAAPDGTRVSARIPTVAASGDPVPGRAQLRRPGPRVEPVEKVEPGRYSGHG
jgi:hypothetical protein